MISKLNLFKNLRMDNDNYFYTYITIEHELFAKTKSCGCCNNAHRCPRYILYMNSRSYFGIKPYGCFNYHQSDDDVYIFVKTNTMKYQVLIGNIGGIS